METFYDNDERSGKDRKIGMLTTIIFHLIVLIIMLCTGIKTTIQQEKAYIFDFSAIAYSVFPDITAPLPESLGKPTNVASSFNV